MEDDAKDIVPKEYGNNGTSMGIASLDEVGKLMLVTNQNHFPGVYIERFDDGDDLERNYRLRPDTTWTHYQPYASKANDVSAGPPVNGK